MAISSEGEQRNSDFHFVKGGMRFMDTLRKNKPTRDGLSMKRRPAATEGASKSASRRWHSQRGAETLAGALVMMMILPLMFMIVDIGWGIFIKVSLQHAVREGVRYAITSQTASDGSGGSLGHLASIKKVTLQAAGGLMNGQEDKLTVKFYDAGSPTLTEDLGSSRNRGGNIVMVNIEDYEYSPIIPVYKIGDLQKLEILEDPPIKITVHAADRMESCPVSGCAAL